MSTTWDPDRYERFAAERAQPFFDLAGLIAPVPGGTVVDLGCGTGALTVTLAERLQAGSVHGYDTSEQMLARAEANTTELVSFSWGDLAAFGTGEQVDVIVSNAALQWVEDHPAVLARWRAGLRPGGQLAVQVPANADHPSHRLAQEVAATEPFLEALGGHVPPDPVGGVLAPERYAEVLDELGFADQHVRLQVYGHHLDSTEAVVDWVDGTTLNRFRAVLPAGLHEAFRATYRERLLEVLGRRAPYFYPFKRILMWGRLAA